jgi:hypothetical protein
VHWWREAIFERIGFARRKGRFESWILANRDGWRGLLAAAVAGVYLFVNGALAMLKRWFGGLDVTRRLLAYLFRQQLDRMAEREAPGALAPLPAETLALLSPRTASAHIIEGADESNVTNIVRHIDATGGGVYAVVGERGSGRSTVLHRVSDTRDDVGMVDCPFEGVDALTAALAQKLDLPAASDLESMAAQLDAQQRDLGIIIDNAHRLIQPLMGGLAEFDRLIDCARRHSNHCAWLISMDRIVWRFYCRARPVNLVFNEIVMLDDWPEEGIAALLTGRSQQAGIEPAFDRLVPELPADADEYVRSEALAHAARSYYRLIWDYAAGNPAVTDECGRDTLGNAGHAGRGDARDNETPCAFGRRPVGRDVAAASHAPAAGRGPFVDLLEAEVLLRTARRRDRRN